MVAVKVMEFPGVSAPLFVSEVTVRSGWLDIVVVVEVDVVDVEVVDVVGEVVDVDVVDEGGAPCIEKLLLSTSPLRALS